jgi:peptide/nickel transport system permease protein
MLSDASVPILGVFARHLRRKPLNAIGLALFCAVIAAAVLAPVLAPYEPTAINASARLHGPTIQNLLGTDELGRDLLSRTLYGARLSLAIAFASVSIAGVVGTAVGMIAAYRGGFFAGATMRLVDLLFAFPALLMALLIVGGLGPATQNVILAISIAYMPTFARLARGATLSIVTEQYMESARAMGFRTTRILARHALPNIIGPMIVQYSISFGYAILVEASLSYVGLGSQPPAPSLGVMVNAGQTYLQLSPLVSLVPGGAITLIVLGINLLGDSLRDFVHGA